jgi:hypothetical protein
MIKPSVLVASLLLSTTLFAETKMSLRDKKYKEEHLKSMGRKKGYQGNKDWSNFIKMAIKYKDKEIINKMLSIEPENMTERSWYIRDLFKIHQNDPEFFISTANEFYKNNMDCVVRLFKYNPAVLEDKEIEEAYKTVKTPSETLLKYINSNMNTHLKNNKLKPETKIYIKCQKIKQEWAKKL